MTFAKVFLFAAATAVCVPAAASIVVVGNGAARNCYLAAESQNRPNADQMNQCNRALAEEGLTAYEVVATHVNRGVLHARRGQLDLAIADFDRGMTLDANEPESYLNKGAALVRIGNPQAALPLFSMALDKNTRKPAVAYYGRGVAYEEMGNMQSAYLDYRRASVADPKWAPPREEMARFTVERR